ncbi:MAG: hypothetical protein A2X86_18880 [Bdellovibrionales bacterium GWA2_49_15]|nr:MAG: hypothetical protein A2X86_18880 [Bdellovibrionales bacterium GWA2_49_15]HAZ14292.1 hypothetical protein [Bdellovibrionales bacterium]
MLNYLKSLCQTLSPFALFCLAVAVSNCSSDSKPSKEILRSIEALPHWFKVEERFVSMTSGGEYLVHPFYDLAPFAHPKELSLNFYVLTPVDSPHAYSLDLVSGQSYKTHSYCDQNDVWGKYGRKVNRPPYTTGIIPRLLDSWGQPQEIIIFGREDFYKTLPSAPVRSHRARVVGGVIDQYCKKIPCSGRNLWDSHVLLVGVDPNDPKYDEVKNLEDLKDLIDWPYVAAFIQNGRGRKVGRDLGVPAYRIAGEVQAEKAFRYVIKNGHYFEFDELKSLRQNCHKLYDYLWDTSLLVRKNIAEQGKQDKLSNYVKTFKKTNVISQEEEVETKVEKKTQSFSKFFADFYKTYGDRFYTCSKLVNYSNINNDQARHWFITYMQIYYKLERLGYFYSCAKKAWMDNPRKADGTWTFDPLEERGSCKDEALDVAFDSAITKLTVLKQGNEEHFRYIDYDNGDGGTHLKLHSWVNVSGKGLQCTSRSEARLAEDKNKVFPDEVTWVDFARHMKMFDDKTIIR